MKENHCEHTFLDDLFGFLDEMLESGSEVHIVDRTNPDHIVEHVFIPDDDEDLDNDLPFDDCDGACECDSLDCEECPYCDEEIEDSWCPEDDYLYGIPGIDHIVFSDPATIVFWVDGTKTVVKTTKGDKFERYMGFAVACVKKMFGSTSHARAVIDAFAVEQMPKEKKSNEALG